MPARANQSNSPAGHDRKLASRRTVLKAALAVPFAASTPRAATVTLSRFPYLQNVGPGSATIIWTTRQQGSGRVDFSSDSSFSRSAAAALRTFPPSETGRAFTYYQYEATLTGLREGIQYQYRVLVDDQNLTPPPSPGQELRFRTAARGPVSFLAFGDSGQGRAEQIQLSALMAQEDVSLVLHTGDVVYPDGSFMNYDAYFFAMYQNMMSRNAFFTVPGNHDYYVDSAAPYLANIAVPAAVNAPATDQQRYYSFDWGDVHFIALDTNDPLISAPSGACAMLDWLERDLQTTRKFWRVAFFHHPPYPTSSHHENDEVSAMVKQYVVPILDRYNVPLVLSGHDHNYQRFVPLRNGQPEKAGIGTQYVITGGGGAGLFDLSVPGSPLVAQGVTAYHYVRTDISGAQATLRAVGIDGKEIDRVVIAPLPIGANPGSVVNAGSFARALAPGSLISIYARNLAYREDQFAGYPLPTDLSGTKVTVNGQAIPLVYASPLQINAQLPFNLSGTVTMVITTPNGSTDPIQLDIAETAPGIFSSAVVHNDGTLVSSSASALPGEYISIYLTGLGRVNSGILAGQPAPSGPLANALAPVQVQFGGTLVNPYFAGLAPGFAGLYQVVFQVPPVADGNYSVRIAARGVASNAISVPVGDVLGIGQNLAGVTLKELLGNAVPA